MPVCLIRWLHAGIGLAAASLTGLTLGTVPVAPPLPTGWLVHPATRSFFNDAQPDAAWWHRANPHFVLTAQVSSQGSPRDPLLHLQPGTPLTILAEWAQTRSPISRRSHDRMHWMVNGPAATFHRHSQTYYPLVADGLTFTPIRTAGFVAHQPGVYTIQAEWQGQYSVPLVITVGLSTLTHGIVWHPSSAATGVVHAASSAWVSDPVLKTWHGPMHTGALRLTVRNPIQGWLPVSGFVPAADIAPHAARAIVLDLNAYTSPSDRNHNWSYTVPLNSQGFFRDWVRLPWHDPAGDLTLTWILNQSAVFTRHTLPASSSARGHYFVSLANAFFGNPAPSLSPGSWALLATSTMDLNRTAVLRPYVTDAMAVVRAAPSGETGVIAVANLVADRISYAYAEATANVLPWASASQTLRTGHGVCQDYATALVTLYRALHIPARLVTGKARSSITQPWSVAAPSPNHAWVSVRVHDHWIAVDPTWDSAGSAPLTTLSNWYTTDTLPFQATHQSVRIQAVTNP